MNREDFKVLPGDGTNHPTDPSQPSVSTNSRPIADAESAEQQIVSKLVPQVSTITGLNGKFCLAFLYKTYLQKLEGK